MELLPARPALSWSSPVKHEFKDIFQENDWCLNG